MSAAPQRDLVWIPPALLCAGSLPSLLAFNEAPSATFLNQALAFLTWGLVAAACAWEIPVSRLHRHTAWLAAWPTGAVLLVLSACAVSSHLYGSLPAALALSALGTLAAAALLLVSGARVGAARAADARQAFEWICAALVLGGLLNAAVCFVQTFAPAWADGTWIARSGLAGRAVGNLRQPNHVCSLLLWAAIGTVGLLEARRLSRAWAAVVLSVLALSLVLTASRTAVLVALALALWGWRDRSLSADGRRALVSVPVLYGIAWLAMAGWARWTQSAFGGEQRLAEADLSASRFGIWSDTITLIGRHAWAGVGFGEFNFAWSLSVMPHRPVAFFDHAHNIALHWAVEQGVPVAVLLTGLLGLALWRIGRACRHETDPERAVALRVTMAALLVMALHSQLEYPLWYAYFLMPTAWLMGYASSLARRPVATDSTDNSRPCRPSPRLTMAGLMLAFGAVASVADYTSVVRIFDAQSDQPLGDRIVQGQHSWFFAHHADYAAATISATPERELEALGRAAHYLLDTRLMTAWAEGLDHAGDTARARYLVQRLREFRNPNSAAFLSACSDVSSPASASPPQPASQPASGPAAPASAPEPTPSRPFQCEGPDPRVVLDWYDFR